MRKFYFLNSSGERWPLQGEKGVYLTDPTGLGVTLAQTYADLQNGFFVGVSSANEPQSAPHATLLFVRPAYAAYRQLINWLAAAATLSLSTAPTARRNSTAAWTCRRSARASWTSTPSLACELSLLARSPWFKAAATRLDLASPEARTSPCATTSFTPTSSSTARTPPPRSPARCTRTGTSPRRSPSRSTAARPRRSSPLAGQLTGQALRRLPHFRHHRLRRDAALLHGLPRQLCPEALRVGRGDGPALQDRSRRRAVLPPSADRALHAHHRRAQAAISGAAGCRGFTIATRSV